MSHRPCLKSICSASPCSAPWRSMPGTDRVRHCGACGNRVYRLDTLSPSDSDALLTWTEGRPVQRFFAREDGTLMTRDCSVGKQAQVERQRRQVQSRWAAMAMAMVGFLGLAATAPDAQPPSHEATPIAARSGGVLNSPARPYSPPPHRR